MLVTLIQAEGEKSVWESQTSEMSTYREYLHYPVKCVTICMSVHAVCIIICVWIPVYPMTLQKSWHVSVSWFCPVCLRNDPPHPQALIFHAWLFLSYSVSKEGICVPVSQSERVTAVADLCLLLTAGCLVGCLHEFHAGDVC